jgi:hypothetical protein
LSAQNDPARAAKSIRLARVFRLEIRRHSGPTSSECRVTIAADAIDA